MVDPVPIQSREPTYKASDIVTRISLTMDVGGGHLGFETHVVRNAPAEDLKNELDKLVNASDWLRAKYNLRNLELTLVEEEKELLRFRNNKADYIAKAETEWSVIGKRRGPLQLTSSQQQFLTSADTSINSRIEKIERLRKEIAVTKAILEGS